MKKIILTLATGLLMLAAFNSSYAADQMPTITNIQVIEPPHTTYQLGGTENQTGLKLYETFNMRMDGKTSCDQISGMNETYIRWQWLSPTEDIFKTFKHNTNITLDDRSGSQDIKPIYLLDNYKSKNTSLYGARLDPINPYTCIIDIPLIYKTGIIISSGPYDNSYYKKMAEIKITFGAYEKGEQNEKTFYFKLYPLQQ